MSGEASSNTDEWQSFIILRVTWEDIELNESIKMGNTHTHTPTRYRYSNNNQQRPHQGRQLYGAPVKKEIKASVYIFYFMQQMHYAKR